MTDLRIGMGVDAHALSGTKVLVLGGVVFPGEHGLVGHSDGDVLAHVLIDAVLGAAGLGDIGSLFPSDDPAWEGASSLDLLRRAYDDVRAAGFELASADCVLIGEKPRIADHRDEMRVALAGAMDVDPALVNVRATTTDGLGFTGPRRGACRSGGRARPSGRQPSSAADDLDQAVAFERRDCFGVCGASRPLPPLAAFARAAGGTSPRNGSACAAARSGGLVTGSPRRVDTPRTAGRAPGTPSRRDRRAPAPPRGRTRRRVRSMTRPTFTSTGSTARPNANAPTASAV